MKTIQIGLAAAIGMINAAAIIYPTALPAGDANAPRERIGVYDSRVVAYAYFTSEPRMQALNARIKAAKDARAGGETAQSRQMAADLKSEQKRIHLQVFSTAPIDDVLASLQRRLPEIERTAGVSKLVSKWDEAALEQDRAAEKVDVTDALAAEFKPGEKELKIIASIKRAKPAPASVIENMKD
jgi:hypothetical protein